MSHTDTVTTAGAVTPPGGPGTPEYLSRLLSRLHAVTPGRDGWLALCPCPGHGGGRGDRSPSLRVTVGEEGRLLVLCRTGCPTAEVLDALGLGFEDLWPAQGEEPAATVCQEPEEPPEADLDLRHDAYSHLLGRLRLTREDGQGLLARGLSRQQVLAGGYKSLPAAAGAALAAELHQRFGDRLFGVPGFGPGPRLLAPPAGGLLVPCRDVRGRVVALKVRRTSGDGPRYVYLSGGPQCSSGSPVHHPLPPGRGWASDYVRLTEGELKADVASALTGRLTLGLPGVGLWPRALAALQALDEPPGRVLVAFDWPDVKSNRSVYSAWRRLVDALREHGYDAAAETWDGRPEKGVDDLLVAGGMPEVVRGDALASLACGLEVSLRPAREYPACLSEWSPAAFPADALPAGVAAFVTGVAAAKECPVDFPGLACLAVLGAAVGGSRCLEVRPGWHELPCLYTAIVADPGAKKTPALKAVMRPLYRLQAEAFEAAEAAGDPGSARRYWCQNNTVEGLVKSLKEQPRGMLMIQDEVVSWVLSENQYRGGRGGDRQFWLQIWSGEPILVDRKTTDTVYVKQPFVGVLGGIQPDMLGELADRQGRQDGFLHRILFAMPPERPPAGWSEERADPEAAAAWDRLVEELYGLERPDDGPGVLHFTPSGRAAFVAWYDAHAAETRRAGFPRRLRGWYSKLYAYCARLALTLCLADDPGASGAAVGDSHVTQAARLVDYFKSHLQGVALRLHSTPYDADLRPLVELAAGKPGRAVSLKEVMRKLGLPTRSAAATLAARAADLGYGDVARLKAGGRAADAFVLSDD